MFNARHILAATAALLIAGPCMAQHAGDIFLDDQDGKLVTGAVVEGEPETPVLVFAAEFGDSGIPRFTSNPGFDTFAGAFEFGTRIGFNVLSGLTVWNGDGFDPVDDEFLIISFLSANVAVANDPVDGFDLAVAPNGQFHRHLDFFLDANGTVPDPGIYLLELEMYSTDNLVDSSEPFWIVFNHNDDGAHQDAIEWVVENLASGTCNADLTGDGDVGPADLAVLLDGWGTDAADLDGDQTTGPADLALLLDAWGSCDG